MKHYIIAKYKPEIQNKEELLQQIRALYAEAAHIPGVMGARVIPNCVARDNRYDVMIVLDMEKDALPAWDASETHKAWKQRFGEMLAGKTIFDAEE